MRLTPVLTSVGLGAGAAYFRKRDVDSGRTMLSKQWGTYVEVGAALVGVLADSMHWNINRDISDPLLFGGLALSSERLSRSAMSGSFGTGSPMSMGAYAGAPYYSSPQPPTQLSAYPARGFATKEKSLTIY